MKSFSASAPRLTPDQLNVEIVSLPLRERERHVRDLYGKDLPIEETEEQLVASTVQLRHAMQRLPVSHKQRYLVALERCPEYANDPDFLLMFLRCEEFDVQKAAERMGCYWDKKVELFGEDRAFRPLTLADFDDEDSEALRLGGTRYLPIKDAAGRGLIFVDKSRYDLRASHRKSMMKQIWYIHHATVEDVEIQQRGIVYVAQCPRSRSSLLEQDRKLDSIILKHVRYALPVRVVGVHHYLDNRLLEIFVPLLLPLFGPAIRARYRYHMERTSADWLEELSKFGICDHCLPTEFGGSLEFSYLEWLESRRQQNL